MSLLLIKDLGMQKARPSSKRVSRYGIFLCPYCKEEFRSRSAEALKGATRMCKSCADSIRNRTHGLSKKGGLYWTWSKMIDRCNRDTHVQWNNYGGRGIKVCKEWERVENFFDWAKDGYREGLTIDRIDNDGDYTPENCQWLTKEQNSRKRGN